MQKYDVKGKDSKVGYLAGFCHHCLASQMLIRMHIAILCLKLEQY